MANKVTVTMYHEKAGESIEVMPAQVSNAEVNGWTRTKPVEPAKKVATASGSSASESSTVKPKTTTKPKS